MMASEARIAANRKNAQLSSGPRTEEGKERSRANALKHGLTGAGVVLPEADASEVARREVAFAKELEAEGEVGQALARRAALNSVRMERAADQQTAALSAKVRQVEAEFVAPEGVDEGEAARLLAEAVRVAMFDTSKEATLARKYEAAAERTFLRCLKELRERKKAARATVQVDVAAQAQAMMGSFLKARETFEAQDDEMDEFFDEMDRRLADEPARSSQIARNAARGAVPITAGRIA